MRSVNLSDYRAVNALETDEQTWVPIGDGLEVCVTSDCEDGDSWDLVIEPFQTQQRVCSDLHGDHVFICSPELELSQIYGNTVWTCADSNSTVKVRGQQMVQVDTRSDKMVTFFGHVFLVSGRKLFWSDLDNPTEWQPMQASEADYRIIEWERLEITALVVVEDQLFIHTPDSMYQAVYVGKPSVVTIRQRLKGAGAVLQKSVQVYAQIQFFLGSDNFYLWSPDHGLTPIGQDIWSSFCKFRGASSELWSYHDKRNNEICWVSGDLVWAFNYIEKTWSCYSREGINGHVNVFWSTDRGGLENKEIENVWCTNTSVCRELRDKEEFGDLLSYTAPFLETDDFTYADLHFVKRVDLVGFDAHYGQPWEGVRVLISARDFVTQPVVWKEVGVWEKELKLKHLDFKTVAGRVLRFRFELVHGWAMQGRTLNGGLRLNGKSLDVYDGRVSLNGQRNHFARHILRFDGSRVMDGSEDSFGPFVLHSWGERVDIGTTSVGADK